MPSDKVREIQLKLFKQIAQKIPEEQDVIDILCDVLHLSKSNVYRRMRGEKVLSIEELLILMEKFHISFDQLATNRKTNIEFYFPYLDNPIKNFQGYIFPLHEVVRSFSAIPDITIYYATAELPFFYYFLSKPLTLFKLFTYAQTTWNLPAYQNRLFNHESMSEYYQFEDSIREILRHYYTIENLEFWNEHILNNTLNQIRTFVYSGLFENPEHAFLLIEELRRIMQHVQRMAEQGKKFLPDESDLIQAPFNLYHNRIIHTNNTLLALSAQVDAVFVAYDNPNFIVSYNPNLIDHTLSWFMTVKRHSISITQDMTSERLFLFNQIEKRIAWVEKEIEHFLQQV